MGKQRDMDQLERALGEENPLTADLDWDVQHGGKFIDVLQCHIQAEHVLKALTQAERLRDATTALLKDVESVIKTQEFGALFEDLSGELDGTLNNFVHTIGRVYDAMEQAGIPARRG